LFARYFSNGIACALVATGAYPYAK
jgi:hypothetical protein